MFVTKWTFNESVQPLSDDKEIVETAGYVPRQKTIENLLLCGQRLIDSRIEEYDGSTVEEALEKAPISRVNHLGLDESLNLLAELSNEAEASKANAGGGVSVSVEKSNNSDGETTELSKEG